MGPSSRIQSECAPLDALTIARRHLSAGGDIELQTERLSGGASNDGLYLHTASTSNGETFRFVEKRPKRNRELIFMEDLYPQLRERGSPYIPEIYAAGERDGEIFIFMEYVVGCSDASTDLCEHPAQIGRAVASVSTMPIDAPAKVSVPDHFAKKLLNQLHAVVSTHCRINREEEVRVVEWLMENRDAAADRLSLLPVCHAHGDVFHENIALIEADGGTAVDVALLDWGDYRIDRVGTDLFHFAGHADRRRLMKSSTFTKILWAYEAGIADHFGRIDRDLLAFAAASRRLSRKAMNAINGNASAIDHALNAAKLTVTMLRNH